MDSAPLPSHAPDHNDILKAGHVMKHEALLASCTLRSTLEPTPTLKALVATQSVKLQRSTQPSKPATTIDSQAGGCQATMQGQNDSCEPSHRLAWPWLACIRPSAYSAPPSEYGLPDTPLRGRYGAISARPCEKRSHAPEQRAMQANSRAICRSLTRRKGRPDSLVQNQQQALLLCCG